MLAGAGRSGARSRRRRARGAAAGGPRARRDGVRLRRARICSATRSSRVLDIVRRPGAVRSRIGCRARCDSRRTSRVGIRSRNAARGRTASSTSATRRRCAASTSAASRRASQTALGAQEEGRAERHTIRLPPVEILYERGGRRRALTEQLSRGRGRLPHQHRACRRASNRTRGPARRARSWRASSHRRRRTGRGRALLAGGRCSRRALLLALFPAVLVGRLAPCALAAARRLAAAVAARARARARRLDVASRRRRRGPAQGARGARAPCSSRAASVTSRRRRVRSRGPRSRLPRRTRREAGSEARRALGRRWPCVAGVSPALPYGELAALRRPIARTAVLAAALGVALAAVLHRRARRSLADRDAQPDPLLPSGHDRDDRARPLRERRAATGVRRAAPPRRGCRTSRPAWSSSPTSPTSSSRRGRRDASSRR